MVFGTSNGHRSHEIIPLICERTIKENVRYDRMKAVASAQCFSRSKPGYLYCMNLSLLSLLFRHAEVAAIAQKFIAHCTAGQKQWPRDLIDKSLSSQIILIGPEGDFSDKEIDMAMQ